MKRFLPWILWTLGVAVVAWIAAALAFRLWFHAFLQSDRCREWLNAAASRALHAKGEFLRLQVSSPEAIYTDGFQARDGAAFQSLKADQLRASVRFGYWARSCEVDLLEIARLRLDFGTAGRVSLPPPSPVPQSAAPGLKTRFALRKIAVADFGATWGGRELKDAEVTATPGEPGLGEWELVGRGGSLRLGSEPEWRVESFGARLRGGTLFLTDARLRTGERGEARVQGEFTPGAPAQFQGLFSGIAVGSWLPLDWRARLTGNLSGQFRFHSQGEGSPPTGEGTVALSDGELSALPLLDKVATLTHADQFRRMRIHKGTAKVVRTGENYTVSGLLVESSGLLKVEGGFEMVAGKIGGTLQVGVAPSALQWVPGAREKVFTVSRDGYLWTPVRLSGLAAHPTEDLTARLAAAAVDQSVNAVQDSVRENARSVIDLVSPLSPLPLPSVPGLYP